MFPVFFICVFEVLYFPLFLLMFYLFVVMLFIYS